MSFRLLQPICIFLSLCFAFSGCGGKQESKEGKETAVTKNGVLSYSSQNESNSLPVSKKTTSNKSDDNKKTETGNNPKNEIASNEFAGNKDESGASVLSGKVETEQSSDSNTSDKGDSSLPRSNKDFGEADDSGEDDGIDKNEIADDSQTAFEKLNQQVANFQVPPAWLKDVTTKWDVANKPWKEGRIEIRRLLGLNTEAARREGIKLTWDYLQKDDIGNKHEYGMYMFLGGEPIWAVIAYRERLASKNLSYPPFFGVVALASLYSDYGAYAEAEKILKRGVKMRPPKREWYEMREAEMHDALGDLYAVWGKMDLAKASYLEAIRLYPLGKPPYGRHLLPRRAKKVQAKLDLLSTASLANATLKDGSYQETALGYSGDIKLTVKVATGKIANIDVRHQEKIDQNACKIIPQRIVEKQSLTVDGISGATVTKDAIVAGTLRALRKAGLD